MADEKCALTDCLGNLAQTKQIKRGEWGPFLGPTHLTKHRKGPFLLSTMSPAHGPKMSAQRKEGMKQ